MVISLTAERSRMVPDGESLDCHHAFFTGALQRGQFPAMGCGVPFLQVPP